MENQRYLGDVEKEAHLAGRLQEIESVARHDLGDRREGWAIAHAFADLEESFERFSHELLPKLVEEEATREGRRELLLEIGEEFRQVLYHLNELRFYEYLQESN